MYAKCLFFCWNVNATSFVKLCVIFFFFSLTMFTKMYKTGFSWIVFFKNIYERCIFWHWIWKLSRNTCRVIISNVEKTFFLIVRALRYLHRLCIFMSSKICDLFIKKLHSNWISWVICHDHDDDQFNAECGEGSWTI